MNVVVEVVEIEEGFAVEVVTTQIIEGVRLEVYDNKEAALCIGESSILFAWTLEAAELWANIDTAETIEMLALLAQAHSLDN